MGASSDSGGPGKFQGGCGAIYEIEMLEEEVDALTASECTAGVVRQKWRVKYLHLPRRRRKFTLLRQDGRHSPDRRTAYPPRPPGAAAAVMSTSEIGVLAEDVRLGYVSPNSAKRLFCGEYARDLGQRRHQSLRLPSHVRAADDVCSGTFTDLFSTRLPAMRDCKSPSVRTNQSQGI